MARTPSGRLTASQVFSKAGLPAFDSLTEEAQSGALARQTVECENDQGETYLHVACVVNAASNGSDPLNLRW